MNNQETKNYVLKHGILLPNRQVLLTEPLKAFKKVNTYNWHMNDRFKNFLATYTNKGCIRNNNDIRNFDTPAIANIIIPAGAVVNVPENTGNVKLRASSVITHSIVRMHDKEKVNLARGYHSYGISTYYVPAAEAGIHTDHIFNFAKQFKRSKSSEVAKFVTNPHDFDMSTTQCASGIHFYAELDKALNH